ncbi:MULTISPECIES: hypothetical protein [unclassified Moorena]|nr:MULTISPECIES: hypothetical protein [unclassified Moorena]
MYCSFEHILYSLLPAPYSLKTSTKVPHRLYYFYIISLNQIHQ